MQKIYLSLSLVLLTGSALAQGSQNFNPKSVKNGQAIDSGQEYVSLLPTIGLYGIGNVSTESFSNINSSGKISGYFRPFKWGRNFITTTFSFNVNASNTDSLMSNTFIFPDVGKNSVFLNAEYMKAYAKDSNNIHLLGVFAELSTKSIKGRLEDSVKYF